MISPPMSVRTPLTECVPASKEFLRFLKEKEGCKALSSFEDTGCAGFHLEENCIAITTEESTSVLSIENSLKRSWHDFDMKKAMRVSLLNQLCAHSQTVQYSVNQAALIAFFKHLLLRESGVADLIIESNGAVSWFGPIESVNHARSMIERMFQQFSVVEELSLEPENVRLRNNSHLDAPESPSAWQDPFSRYYGTAEPQTLERAPSLGSPTETTNDVSQVRIGGTRRKERLMFMVRSSDAPRLIGTRGVNKKRIEDATGCSITLHTESKKDGEFPVEIIGQNTRHCETAKSHIESFLSNSGSSVEEEKKFRERPKVHLVFSPKKTPGTPRKEKEDHSL
ncbi:unnamed protein product [Auanema sp. JU1783]|nr:unnamed protein product [Auanema sp. JU1783]